jgi:hypothetical protein
MSAAPPPRRCLTAALLLLFSTGACVRPETTARSQEPAQHAAMTLVEVSGRHRTVYPYAPRLSWPMLTDIEDLIDTVAGTARWSRCEREYCHCRSSEEDFETPLLHGGADADPE